MGASSHLPPPAILAALGLSPEAVSAVDGGFSGFAWKVSTSDGLVNLRYGSTALTETRLLALEAARAAGLPVPALVDRVTTEVGDGVLLSWLPGTTMYAALVESPDRAVELGSALGSAQRRLHEVDAPNALPAAAMSGSQNPDAFESDHGVRDLPAGRSLLHLDIHPLNVLVDGGRVSAILDWDNARRGHPLLDLARTRSILTEDPTVAELAPALAEAVQEFVGGWESGYGPAASSIPDACRAWASRVLWQTLAATGRLGVDR